MSVIRQRPAAMMRTVPDDMRSGVAIGAVMNHLRLILAAARVVAILVVVAVFIKIGPTLANHAAGHSNTYAAPPAAASATNAH